MPFLPFFEYGFCWPAPGAETALLAIFALLAALTLLYALPERKPALRVAGLIHAAGGLIALTASDLIVLLLAWELATFSAFFILTQSGRSSALRAGLRYIVTQTAAAALFFVGAAIHWNTTGSLAVAPGASAAQPFFLAAILIKTAMMPLHVWLMDAYPRASYAGSALLSVYTTKIGVFTAARIVRVSLFGQPILALIGAAVALGAVLAALRQRDARRLLSWHIVSQLGFMLAGVGLAGTGADAEGLGTEAGLFHAVNHIVYKALLLMVAGVVGQQFGHDDLFRMGGAARKMPVTFAVGVIGAAAIVGVPPFSGYASKELLKQAADSAPVVWLLVLASVGTALSFLKFISLIFLKKPAPADERPLADPCGFQLAPMLVLAALCVVFGLKPDWIASGFEGRYYTSAGLAFGLIPVGFAGAIWFFWRRRLAEEFDRPMPDHPVRWMEKVAKRLTVVLPRLRAAQGWHPQNALTAMILFWLGLALWLSLASG